MSELRDHPDEASNPRPCANCGHSHRVFGVFTIPCYHPRWFGHWKGCEKRCPEYFPLP
jgi:hypothetical protein